MKHQAILERYHALAREKIHLHLTGHVEELPAARAWVMRGELGAIYTTADFGTHVMAGPIMAHYQQLGAENSWLGLPVSDELLYPPGQFSYVVFEHGFIQQPNDGSPPTEHPHDYLRIYAALRQQIYARFFAVGYHGRRNLLGAENWVNAPIPAIPPIRAPLRTRLDSPLVAELQQVFVQRAIEEHDTAAASSEATRWNTAATGGENPHLFGTWLFAMMAVEHAAGNRESTNALTQALQTIESLSTALEPEQIPTRWDAGAPTDDTPAHFQQFLTRDGHVPRVMVPPSDFNHLPWRLRKTLRSLMSIEQATEYEQRQNDYWAHYRTWEPSMDEVTGMISSLWLVNTLSTDAAILAGARRQARRVGNYLASNGYILVKPLGGVSYRGGTGILPMLEEPFARALAAITGQDFHSQADFQQAMEFAGYWPQLAGPIGRMQALVWTATIASLAASGSLDAVAGLIGSVEEVFANQILSPSTLGAALAILAGAWDCMDLDFGDEDHKYPGSGEVALAALGKGAPDKVGLFRALVTSQSNFGNSAAGWSLHFPAYYSITGLDQSDPLVRDAFRNWFNIRSSLGPTLEPELLGATKTCWVTAVAALLQTNPDSETVLLDRLDRAVCFLFRDCYFEPQIPVVPAQDTGAGVERLCVFRDTGPYGPLDFCGAVALASWHARRQQDAGSPVSARGFPVPLTADLMSSWPVAGVPAAVLDTVLGRGISKDALQSTLPLAQVDGVYPLFNTPLVPRRSPPVAPESPANVLIDIRVFFVDPRVTGDLATGVMLNPGQALEVFGDGDIWAGDVLHGNNGPGGLEGLIDDSRWPLHTGLDPGQAFQFALLGRLNGYFFIGDHFGPRKWVLDQCRELFLRINDPGLGDGNGGFVARVQIWGPEGSPVHAPYNLLRDGGLLLTDEPRDRIYVHLEPGNQDSNSVEFVLETPDTITWRKELVLTSGNASDPGSWTLYTQDDRHLDSNGLWITQLAGGSLVFRRLNPWPSGMTEVATVVHLERATPGTRIVFTWYQD